MLSKYLSTLSLSSYIIKTQEAMAIFLNEPTECQKSSEFEKRAEKMRVVLGREEMS
jgi:hypothetical protein